MSGILDRIDAAVEDWERGPDAMRWSPELAEGDPTAATPLADFWHFDGRSFDGRIASIWIFDEIQDYVQRLTDLPDRLLWQPVEWEVAPDRADLPRGRVHALDREPVAVAALAAADCDPLDRPEWLIDRQREAAEVRLVLAAVRNPVQEWP